MTRLGPVKLFALSEHGPNKLKHSNYPIDVLLLLQYPSSSLGKANDQVVLLNCRSHEVVDLTTQSGRDAWIASRTSLV